MKDKPIKISNITKIFERLRKYRDSAHVLISAREECFNIVHAFRKHFGFSDEFGQRVKQNQYREVVEYFLEFVNSNNISNEEREAINNLSSEELFDRMRSANLRSNYTSVLERSEKKSELLKEFKAALAWSVSQQKLKK